MLTATRTGRLAPLVILILSGPGIWLSTSVAFGQALPPDQLKKIKAATAFIKVESGEIQGTGSGFLVKADGLTGLVVTNDHVVTMKWKVGGPNQPRQSVAVVFNSGTPTEWTAPAQVVAQDPDRDLALVRFQAPKTLPEPLVLAGPVKLPETTPVFVCGFPFGSALAEGDKNPEISISASTVSSIRTNESGEVASVELNGAVNPGNSGGPVVATDGKLIGVTVSGVRGSGIGRAIPHHHVGELLKGRVSEPQVIVPSELAALRQAVIVARVIDPNGKIKSARAVCAPAPRGGKPPAEVGKLQGAHAIPLAPLPNNPFIGMGRIILPIGVNEIWVQSEWKETDGLTRRGAAYKVRLGEQSPEGPTGGLPPGFVPPSNPPPPPPAGSGGSSGSPFGGAWGSEAGTAPPAAPPSGDATPGALTGPNGSALPPIATRLPASPPADQVDIRTLNANAGSYVGQIVVIDVITSGVSSKGYGDGPSLICYDENNAQPGGIDFLLDARMATNLTAAGLAHGGPHKVAVRVKGTVKEPSPRRTWKQLHVEEVGLIGESGTVVATFTLSGGTVAPGVAPPWKPTTPADADRKLADLAKAGERAVGTTHDLQLLLAGVSDETVRTPSSQKMVRRLSFWNSGKQPVPGLKILVPESLAGQIRTAYAQLGGKAMNARVTVQVTDFDRSTQDILCSATKLDIYDEAWSTIRWTGTSTKEPTPEPPPTTFTGPAFTGPPPVPSQPIGGAGSTSDSAMPIVLLAISVGVLLLIVAGGVGLFFVLRKKKVPEKKKPYRRDVDEDDDYEDEDDYEDRRRPRGRGRR